MARGAAIKAGPPIDDRTRPPGRPTAPRRAARPPRRKPAAPQGRRARRAADRAGRRNRRRAANDPLQLTNSVLAAWLARLRTGSGTMPSTTVAITPRPTALPVKMLGTTTSGPSGTGSLKNISTITRT